MKIHTSFIYPPIPDRSHDWSAIDEDTYDDSKNRHVIGYGETEEAAIAALLELLTADETFEVFLKRLTVPELVVLAHDLRGEAQDRQFLHSVLTEIGKRGVY